MLTTLSIISLDQGKIWRPEPALPEGETPLPDAAEARNASTASPVGWRSWVISFRAADRARA